MTSKDIDNDPFGVNDPIKPQSQQESDYYANEYNKANWDKTPKQRYLELHKRDFATRYPTAFKDGHYSPGKYPDVKTSNGITTYVVNFINWHGGLAERTGVEGRTISTKDVKTASGAILQGKTVRIKSSGRKGATDISAVIFGKSLKIEIKNKYTHDTIKPKQQEYADKAIKAGALHLFCTDVESFVSWFDKIVKK